MTNRVASNTVNNTCVRFMQEGFSATPPFVLGVSSFGGLSGALITYKGVSETPVPKINAHKSAVASMPFNETAANQLEGAAAVSGGTLIGILAVSLVTASLLRAKHCITTDKQEIMSDQLPVETADTTQACSVDKSL